MLLMCPPDSRKSTDTARLPVRPLNVKSEAAEWTNALDQKKIPTVVFAQRALGSVSKKGAPPRRRIWRSSRTGSSRPLPWARLKQIRQHHLRTGREINLALILPDFPSATCRTVVAPNLFPSFRGGKSGEGKLQSYVRS